MADVGTKTAGGSSGYSMMMISASEAAAAAAAATALPPSVSQSPLPTPTSEKDAPLASITATMTTTTTTPTTTGATADGPDDQRQPRSLLRPKMDSRKTSTTMIISRDAPNVLITEEVFGEDDARAMSPRRSGKEVERMGQEARRALQEQARRLQDSLRELLDRLEIARCESNKLEGENRFLQSYIGELMATSKITSTGAGGGSSSSGRSKGGRSK